MPRLFSQIYNKGKATIKNFIAKEKPQFVSLALDGWSAHHHGYLGSIASTVWHKEKVCLQSFYQTTSLLIGEDKPLCLDVPHLTSVTILPTLRSGWPRSWTTGSWAPWRRWSSLTLQQTNLESSTLSLCLTCLSTLNHRSVAATSSSCALGIAFSPGPISRALSRTAGCVISSFTFQLRFLI